MWTFDRQHGTMIDPQGNAHTPVYSGQPGQYKNNPAFEKVHDFGPIPAGLWRIVRLIVEETPHGPYVLVLEPEPGTVTFGRAGFLGHGDNVRLPGTASKGCIIMARVLRELVWTSGDRLIRVI